MVELNNKGGVDLNSDKLDEFKAKIDKHILEEFEKGNLNSIKSEKEYWERHKYYKKKLSKIFNSTLKYIGKPYELLLDFEKVLAEMEFIQLLDEDYIDNQRIRLYKELNKPNEFKWWIDDTIEKMNNKKDVLIKKLSKKKNQSK